jgi:exodeoxyribonuclease VII large subunit
VAPRSELEAATADLRRRLDAALRRGQEQRRKRLAGLAQRLPTPQRRLEICAQRLDDTNERFRRALVTGLRLRRSRLETARRALRALGPLESLGRGYAIATSASGKLLRQADQVDLGESVHVRLNRGALECTVDTVVLSDDLDLRGRRGRS